MNYFLNFDALLYVLTGLALVAAVAMIVQPSLTRTREGKMFAFVALFILPLLALGLGASDQLQRSEQTRFCLSCHIMAPFGQSLHVDDPKYLAAAHVENHLVPPDAACYTCHTDYGQFGTVHAKLEGLHHVYVQYFGTPMKPIRLYHPYNNRECLHCHAGMRVFVEDPTHAAIMDTLTSNQLSCVSSGCHDVVHNVSQLSQTKPWEPPHP